jgi:hypothetical protein
MTAPKHRVWEVIKAALPPMGHDPTAFGTIDHPFRAADALAD